MGFIIPTNLILQAEFLPRVERVRRVEKVEKVPREAKVAIDGATRTGNPTVRVGRQGIPPSISFHGKGRTMEPVAPLSC